MIAIILCAIAIALFYKFLVMDYDYWESKKIPYEKPVPLFGSFLKVALRKQSLGFALKESYDKFSRKSSIFGVYIFRKPFLVVADPQTVKQVLVKEFDSFPNRNAYRNEKIDPISANVLFTLKNDEWRSLRRKLTPIFATGKIKLMFPLIKEVTDDLKSHLKENIDRDIDVRDLFKRYAIDTISSCAFGINSKCILNENSEIKKMVYRMLNTKSFVRTLSTFAYLFCPILVQIFRLTFVDRTASQYLIGVFKNVSEERKKLKIKRHDLIDCLHAIEGEEKTKDSFKLGKDNIKMSAQAIVFFNAGNEPSSAILSFLMYELALNSDIQNKLRAEIDQHLKDGELSYEKLTEMSYLNMCLKETFRKYPVVPALFRYAEKDVTLDEMVIEKGTPVIIPVLSLHYDPKNFPHSYKFLPDRFENTIIDEYTFLPFGDGPRKCIGDRFAIMQMKAAIVTLLKDFEVVPNDKTQIPMKFSNAAIFLMPESGAIHLTIRNI